MGNLELNRHDRRDFSDRRSARVCFQFAAVARQRRNRRERSLGCLDSRVVHEFTSARIQLCQDSRCQEPASALGHQASGRSGLEVRIDRRTRLSSGAIARPLIKAEWALPSRGRVGMLSLIAAEAAIFTIFVVAYIFYIGKSLSGPMPKDVLELPIFSTVCLLSSSLTIHLAVRALRNAKVGAFGLWWFVTIALGAIFLVVTGREWQRLIFEKGLTVSTNLFGTTYYSLVGLHAFHVTAGLLFLAIGMIFTLMGKVKPEHSERADIFSLYWHFVDVVWVVVFTVVYVIGR